MMEVTAAALATHPFLHGMSRDQLAVLAEAASDVERPHPESVTVTAVHGFPVEELINAGKEADLTVLGSRGAGGFTRLLMGSTAGQVVQHSHSPVVIVPPQDRN
jgi:nucleotide-binding universal stress UspA family protein